MDIIEDGYLGVNIDGSSILVRIVDIAVCSIAFLAQSAIGVMAVRGMRKTQIMNMMPNALFLLSLFCASACTLCLSMPFLNEFESEYPLTPNIGFSKIALCVYGLLFACFVLSLLGILILRLHSTFKDTAYRMSPALISFFIIILSVFSAIVVVSLILYWMMDYSIWWETIIQMALAMSLLVVFVIGCFSALCYFVSTLNTLAKTQGKKHRIFDTSSADDIALNEHQQALSDLAAKFMMLFGIAIMSTMLSPLLLYAINQSSGLRSAVIAVDITINLNCLYLQFSFAKNQYLKCCGCCDRNCRRFISKRTQRSIHKHHMDLLLLQAVNSQSRECNTPPTK